MGASTDRAVCACGKSLDGWKAMGNHSRHCKLCTLEFRVSAKIDKSAGPDACWPWTGAITAQHGYGCVQAGRGRVVGAHKLAWTFANGPVPDGLCVLHKCDNRPCCNPAHLFLGTKKDNALDKSLKGRDKTAKLTPDQVREVRTLLPKMQQQHIAKLYGVSNAVICDIHNGYTYRHVK